MFFTFSEDAWIAQPLNLNTAFHEESLSQMVTGKLLSYFSTFSLQCHVQLCLHLFSTSCILTNPDVSSCKTQK